MKCHFYAPTHTGSVTVERVLLSQGTIPRRPGPAIEEFIGPSKLVAARARAGRLSGPQY